MLSRLPPSRTRVNRCLVLVACTLLVCSPGCCLLVAPFKAEFERKLSEGLGKAFAAAFADIEDGVALGMSALSFSLLEGRWPESREELERGALAIEPPDFGFKSRIDLIRYQHLDVQLEPDGTLYIFWRRRDQPAWRAIYLSDTEWRFISGTDLR